MKRIIFVDNSSEYTHKSVLDRPIGASEYNFYNTLYKLSSLIENISFICFNKLNTPILIDNVSYQSIANILNYEFKDSDTIIIQRLFPDLDILLKFKCKNVFLTQQDYDFNAIMFQFQQDKNKNKIINHIYKTKNIKFIYNSAFTKDYMNNNFNKHNIYIEDNRVAIVPNYIFEEYFKKDNNSIKNKFQLVYASGWNKGIIPILHVFNYIIKKNNNFKLILMSPGYEYSDYNDLKNYIQHNFKNNITILGPTKKDVYCKIIQESICVFAPPFPETFGCVFSETYYLGTNVIADIRSGAVVEIIGSNNITDYSNYDKTYEKLLEIISRDEKVELNNKFIFDINTWKKVLEL
jgi:glycosyltransferase involved in cell wall biosynthesis